MLYRIQSKSDLKVWVNNVVGVEYSNEERNALVEAILEHDDCPNYGTAWNEFFDALPDDLFELIDTQLYVGIEKIG